VEIARTLTNTTSFSALRRLDGFCGDAIVGGESFLVGEDEAQCSLELSSLAIGLACHLDLCRGTPSFVHLALIRAAAEGWGRVGGEAAVELLVRHHHGRHVDGDRLRPESQNEVPGKEPGGAFSLSPLLALLALRTQRAQATCAPSTALS